MLQLFARKPWPALVVIAVLSVGTGAALSLFSLVDAVFLRPLPYPQANRLVWLRERDEDVPSKISYPNFLDWHRRSTAFHSLAAVKEIQATLTKDGHALAVDAGLVTADYFRVIGVPPFIGRNFSSADDHYGAPGVAIISYELWQTQYEGARNVLGTRLSLNNRRYSIIGVMPRTLHLPGRPQAWILTGQQAAPGSKWLVRSNRMAGYVIGRLKAGWGLEQARAEMTGIEKQLAQEFPGPDARNSIEMLTFQQRVTGDLRTPLLLCFGAVGVLLLIVCVNVSNLLLVRATSRQHEFAVRAALGAGRRRLFFQVLRESAVLAAAGSGLGLLLAMWITRLIAQFVPADLVSGIRFTIGLPVIAFALFLAIFVAVLAGFVPAWKSTSVDLRRTLGAATKSTAQRGSGRFRNSLVVAQTALAVALLICAGLLTTSLSMLLRSHPGFDKEGVLTFKLLIGDQYKSRAALMQLYGQLLQGVKSIPGIEAATILNDLPGFDPAWQTNINPEINGRYQKILPGEYINVAWGIISSGFFKTMGIRIIKGRSFTEEEAEEGAPVMLIDESLAKRFWPDGGAVGSHIKYDSPTPIEIIGIAANVRTYGDEDAGRIKIYTPYGRFPLRNIAVAVRSSGIDPLSLAPPIKHALAALDPTLPMYDVSTLAHRLSAAIAPRKLMTWIVGLFAGFAVLLSCLGIYSVMSYVILERAGEYGTRMALGAEPRDIMKLVVRKGMILSGIGIGLGLSLGIGLAQLLSGVLFGVAPLSLPIFLAGSLLFCAVAAISCVIPARHASRLPPTAALRV